MIISLMRSDMVRAMTERWESRMFPSRKNVDFRRVNSTVWMENWREKWKISSMRIIIPSGWTLKNLKLYIVENGFLASGYIGLQYSQLLLKTISRLAAVGVFRMKKGKKKKVGKLSAHSVRLPLAEARGGHYSPVAKLKGGDVE